MKGQDQNEKIQKLGVRTTKISGNKKDKSLLYEMKTKLEETEDEQTQQNKFLLRKEIEGKTKGKHLKF